MSDPYDDSKMPSPSVKETDMAAQEDDCEEYDDDAEPSLVGVDHGYDTAEDDNANHMEDPDLDEPKDTKVNSLRFASCCVKLERIWKNKREKQVSKRWKEKERLELLLPRAMLQSLNGQTVFPWVRLLLPEQDSHRQFSMKDKKISEMYCNALGFGKGSRLYNMMFQYQDPTKVPDGCAGDLSLVVEYILKQRIPSDYSEVTVGEINELLDENAKLRAHSSRGNTHHNHQWRESQFYQGHQTTNSTTQERKKPTLAELRSKWIQKVMKKNLSPLEHKWLVRILLKKMEISVGYVRVLKWISPYAQELWNSHNNLKKVCAVLADPSFASRRKEIEELQKRQAQGLASQWEPQVEKAVLGNVISPMVSMRSSFEKLMTQSQTHHQSHLKKFYPTEAKAHRPLSLRFPALTAEIKLDGERFIVHVSSGRVTMNTRNSKWYSHLYAPVLGPPLRRSLAKYSNVNVILDGEVESWDNIKKCLIPFGENRTVANYRRTFLKHHGLLDPLDENLHPDEDDPNVQRTSTDFFNTKISGDHDEKVSRGEHLWLKFMAFDILYVDGKDARRLLTDCGVSVETAIGSIIGLPLLQRKQILYRLLTIQENQVEICPTRVIRCNGDFVSGEEYFSTTSPIIEFGYPAIQLDSTQATIQGDIPDLKMIDEKRMMGRTASHISRMRARAIEGFYSKVVEDYKFEGLVVKDLASPYIMGSRKFWWKFKPDYETGEAVDIDVIILGATFATGLRDGGTPSSYLVGVADRYDQTRFLTLCTLNANSVNNDTKEKMWIHTGFKKGGDGETMQLGKWFREQNFTLPDFVSQRSFQRGTVEDYDGWKFNKAKGTYPNLWIDPNDSIVLEIKGQELVESEEHSCGLSVRFPKIKKVRLEAVDGDEKKASEITTDQDLWNLFDETRTSRSKADVSGIPGNSQSRHGSGNSTSEPVACRFLTPEEYSGKSRKTKRRSVTSPAKKMPRIDKKDRAAILENVTFVVLEGKYELSHGSLEARQAEEEGWIEEAKHVKSEYEVMQFILKNGGNLRSSNLSGAGYEFYIGGTKNDARVTNLMRGLEAAKKIANPTTVAQKRLVQMTQSVEGILKWTFVYHLVYRWKMKGLTGSIVDSDECLLVPGPQDYLAKVEREVSVEEEIFSLCRTITEREIQRALATSPQGILPWQYGGLELPIAERWVLASKYTTLWPYHEDTDDPQQETVVLYPDIFANFGMLMEEDAIESIRNGSDLKRWEALSPSVEHIMAVIPLARQMGAFVTPHFYSGVNTILCDLTCDIKDLFYEEGECTVDIFNNHEQGKRLLERLRGNDAPKPVRLVSPSWILEKTA